MKNTDRLTDNEIQELSHKIGEKIYEYVNLAIEELFKERLDGGKSTNVNDFVNVVVIAMTSVDANILSQLRKFYGNYTGKQIDVKKLIHTYHVNFETQLPNELKSHKERMN